MSIILEIKKCEDCPHISDVGTGIIKRYCCNHPKSVKKHINQFNRLVNPKKLESWCPMKKRKSKSI